jgi:hypothetical protein
MNLSTVGYIDFTAGYLINKDMYLVLDRVFTAGYLINRLPNQQDQCTRIGRAMF